MSSSRSSLVLSIFSLSRLPDITLRWTSSSDESDSRLRFLFFFFFFFLRLCFFSCDALQVNRSVWMYQSTNQFICFGLLVLHREKISWWREWLFHSQIIVKCVYIYSMKWWEQEREIKNRASDSIPLTKPFSIFSLFFCGASSVSFLLVPAVSRLLCLPAAEQVLQYAFTDIS